MNIGAAIFLITVILVGAFVGLGYLASNTNQLSSENQTLQTNLNSAQNNLEAEQQTNESLKIEISDYQNQLAESQKYLAEERTLNGTLQSDNSQLKQQLSEARSTIANERSEKEKALFDNQQMQNQIVEITKTLQQERDLKYQALLILESKNDVIEQLRSKLKIIEEHTQQKTSWLSNLLGTNMDIETSSLLAFGSLALLVMSGLGLVKLMKNRPLRGQSLQAEYIDRVSRNTQSNIDKDEFTLHLDHDQLKDYIKWLRTSNRLKNGDQIRK